MMNLGEFEHELNEMERSSSSNKSSASDLHKIREHLLTISEKDKRSDQQQSWAWTRFSAAMEESKKKPNFIGNWALGGIAAMLMVFAFASYDQKPAETPNGNQVITLTVNTQDSASSKPEVIKSRPNIYAVPFYSEDAEAEVIWATGYDYLPANYQLE